MRWDRVHVGQHRQSISMDEAEAVKDAGGVPGITPDLHAPVISNPADEAEMNLHGDIEGSPYSSEPGKMSLSEADKKEKGGSDAVGDTQDTRAREMESRRTGVDTETLAAEEEAGDNKKPARASGKK